MNLSKSIKRRIFSFYILITLLGLSSSLFAQKDYDWEEEAIDKIEVPDIFKDADAVILHQSQKRQTLFENDRFFTRFIFRRRFKILTEKGRSSFTRIKMPDFPTLSIKKLDARTIKQDGSIVDLDAKEIKSVAYNDDTDFFDKDKYKIFAVPGVEVGDEFEVFCTIEGLGIQYGGNIFLNYFAPIVKAEFIVEVDKNIIVLNKSYNGMPDPIFEENLNNFSYNWTQKNIPAIFDERGASMANELPNFIYELNLDRFYGSTLPPQKDNWLELMKHVNKNYFKPRINSKKKFKALLPEILGDDPDKFKQVAHMQQYLNENIRLRKIERKDDGQGLEYFLEKKIADQDRLIQIYALLLKEIGLNHYLASARSKYEGPIQLDFPTSLQITDYLFVIEDEQSKYHFLMPKAYDHYLMDETPYYLHGTSIYLLSLDGKDNFLKVDIPTPSANKNLRSYKIKTNVNLEELTTSFEASQTLSGVISQRERRYFIKSTNDALQALLSKRLDNQIAGVKIENVEADPMPQKHPYKYKLKYSYKAEDLIQNLDENVYSLDIKNWIAHDGLNVKNENRNLDYLPEHAYSENFTYAINFSEPVKISNLEDLKLETKNELGSYALHVAQSNPTTVIIRSIYSFDATLVPFEKMSLINELSKASETASDLTILFEKVK